MVAKSYGLDFDGYWREPNVGGLPSKSGIYCVYACTYDATAQTVDLKRLLYIGEAADVHGRVKTHEGWQTWKKQLQAGQASCVSAAMIAGESDRQRAEAAMIFKHKPPCNTEYGNAFPFDSTTVTVTGKTALLYTSFTVQRTEAVAKTLLGGGRW
jgi:excinuclease UvrABC nuclease subunit